VTLGTEAQAVLLLPSAKQPAAALKRELGLRDLTLFAIGCVISVRWLPIAAHAGPGSMTLWLLAAVFFVVPLTIAEAALVAKYPGAGGLYLWTRHDFGAWHGFLCSWSYWMGIAFLFPTAALLYMTVAFSLLGPAYANIGDNRYYLLAAAVGLIWIALGSNMIGMKIGKWTENLGALANLGRWCIVSSGGMAGLDATRKRDTDAYRSAMELGDGEFLGGHRVRNVRHGVAGNDGRGIARP